MATTVVSTATHQIPPMSIPRVRPPRMLKGTPSPNTNPQPTGPAARNRVWVQGQWRNPSSNAAKHIQEIQSRQVEKAIHHETHGMNIYAYNHIRTHQVVYSLTKNLDNTTSLHQMLYHGKKTVPSALRRDMWRPYFSVHFARTPAGSRAGLLAYQRLRELSVQRQLAPPKDLITTTQADIDRKKAVTNPVFLEEKLNEKKPEIKGDPRFKLPILGQILPKQIRSRVLRNQKATSVADVAFVLAMANATGDPEELHKAAKDRLLKKYKAKGTHGRAVIRQHRRLEEERKKIIQQRVVAMQEMGKNGKLQLDRHTSHRLSMEYDGVLDKRGIIDVEDIKGMQSDDVALMQKTTEKQELSRQISDEIKQRQHEAVIKAREEFVAQSAKDGSKALFPSKEFKQVLAHEKEAYMTEQAQDPSSLVSRLKQIEADIDQLSSVPATVSESSPEVKILWSDLRDGTYAESWPENVYHAELQPRAIAHVGTMAVRQEAMTDSEGHFIEEQKAYRKLFAGSSVHVMGGEKPDGWVPHSQRIEQELFEDKEQKLNAIRVKQQEDDRRAAKRQAKKEAKGLSQLGATDSSEGEGSDRYAEFNNDRDGLDVLNRGPQVRDSSRPTRQQDIDAMKEQGVEVDAPKQGIWGRVKGIFGR